ncbi:MAG: hypothetical protein H6704_26715 [Myxococcales bacterium]|nr:hypothetical protein [Myxococcales bacterium]
MLADNGADRRIFRFNLQGEYLGAIELPRQGQTNYEPIGFASVDGRPVAGSDIGTRLYYVDVDPPEPLLVGIGDGFDTLIGLTDGAAADQVVALMRRGGAEFRLYGIDTRLRPHGEAIPRAEIRYMTRFLDGFLAIHINGITRYTADLEDPTPGEDWDQRAATNIGARGGIAWLD